MPDPDLTQRVMASTGLRASEAERVISDIVAYHRIGVEEFVRRRHAELQGRGVRNPQAFALIAADLAERVVAPPQLSERQLRRIVYG